MSPTPKVRWPSRRFILWLAMSVFAVLILGPLLLNLVLRVETVKSALKARLESSFGRPVDVGSFSVSLLGGARVEANYVTVAEDPRFGHEFFLRAERITASVRWRALLRGQLEFGTLSMLRPSLNVVRNSEGRWNVIAWLPPSGAPRPASGANDAAPPRLYRINVDTGRVNFKQGPDKHPFALVDVNGIIAQGGGGSWQLDLEAQAFRAGAMAQEPGAIRVRGSAGGALSRIVPADLIITWNEAAVADALRLLRGNDFGVRGELAAELRVRSSAQENPAAAAWTLAGSARLEGLHGRNLPPRATDPALNLRAEAEWHPAQSRVEVESAMLESANSTIRASGVVGWSAASRADSSVRVVSPGTSLADLFAIYRAFRIGVSAQATLNGNLSLDAGFSGWPLALDRLVMASSGAQFRSAAGEDVLETGRATLRFDSRRARFDLAPVSISSAPASSPVSTRSSAPVPVVLRFEGVARRQSGVPAEFALTGDSRSAQVLQSAGAALGLYSVSLWRTAGWNVEGPTSVKLRWRGTLLPFAFKPLGTLEARRAVLSSPIFPEPVEAASFRIEFGDALKFSVSDASGYGGRWSGSLVSAGARAWQVSLAAPRLDAGVLERWTNQLPSIDGASLRSALSSASGAVRITGRAVLNPRLPSPLFQGLRSEDVSLEMTLQLAPRRTLQLSGTLAAPRVERPPPAISQR